MEIKEKLNEIDLKIDQPLIDARFGDMWKEHQKQMLDHGQISTDDLIRIAWRQGRRAILLERELSNIYAGREWLQRLQYSGAADFDSQQKEKVLDYIRYLKWSKWSAK